MENGEKPGSRRPGRAGAKRSEGDGKGVAAGARPKASGWRGRRRQTPQGRRESHGTRPQGPYNRIAVSPQSQAAIVDLRGESPKSSPGAATALHSSPRFNNPLKNGPLETTAMRVPAVERLLAVVGYLPFLFWVPVVAKRDSMFCQFHGRQSGVLWGLWFVPTAILFVVSVFVLSGAGGGKSLDLMQAVIFGILGVLGIIYLVMVLVGIAKSLLRERYRMPVVADVALLLRL